VSGRLENGACKTIGPHAINAKANVAKPEGRAAPGWLRKVRRDGRSASCGERT
jgi:hypothetical protein